jgi:antitoxin ParD1/3/4
MKIDLDQSMQRFVKEAVAAGRYPSADAMVATALELLASNEQKLADLRILIADAEVEGGEIPDEDLTAVLDEAAEALRPKEP